MRATSRRQASDAVSLLSDTALSTATAAALEVVVVRPAYDPPSSRCSTKGSARPDMSLSTVRTALSECWYDVLHRKRRVEALRVATVDTPPVPLVTNPPLRSSLLPLLPFSPPLVSPRCEDCDSVRTRILWRGGGWQGVLSLLTDWPQSGWMKPNPRRRRRKNGRSCRCRRVATCYPP